MSFFSSLFPCCFGGSSSENEKAESQARHARIVSLYAGSTNPPECPVMLAPPSYADIAHDRQVVVVVSDEKTPPPPIPDVEPPQHPTDARRFSVSSRSSVVSVPSTRLSDLTSMHTGATRRGNDRDRDNMSEWDGSWRSRRWCGTDPSDSAPPSYYAGSTRSITPVPTPPLLPTIPPPAVVHDQHPVMQAGWLEGLMFDAERERIPQLYLSNCNTQR